MLNVAIVVFALAMAGYLALSKRLRNSSDWQATVTPLASIMGSGFLVSAPLLAGIIGVWAVVGMAGLLALAYAVGGAIRFNIRHFEPIENDGHGLAQDLGFLSRVVLAGAYFISVSYYLQLLAAFVLDATGVERDWQAPWVTTGLLVLIGGIGIWKGLAQLEKLERYAVALNLGVIGTLILALLIYNVRLLSGGEWELPRLEAALDLHGLRLLLGLLIVVQGFETSRYLGDQHPAEQRIRTMRRAQLISAVIYLCFIGLATVLFRDGLGSHVTAITKMTLPVAVVLPLMIAVAAIGSQFTAAVADTEGAGGLIEDISHKRLPVRYAYLLILCVTIVLTWETDVNQIIAYASRAFALFYTLQCGVAATVAWQQGSDPRRGLRVIGFLLLALCCLMVFLFGLSAE